MNTSITIPADTAGKLWIGQQVGDYVPVETDYEITSSRWMSHHYLVFRTASSVADDFWAIEYALGLTECQENELPWEDSEHVKAIPVRPHLRTVTDWKEVKD